MKRLLDSLTWKQILSIVVVAGGVMAGLVSLSRWNQERDFRPLYSSLSPEDAAAVLTKVKEAGKLRLEGRDYVMRDGDIIHIRFKI